MAEQADRQALLKAAANNVGDVRNADVLLYNFEILPPLDFQMMMALEQRNRRKDVVLILVTEGGSADSAFRMMRALQSSYDHITVVVSGWCKSAGTLMVIGAHELQMQGLGELGPLDVQIVKADEMDEQKSGLAAEAAFEKLQQETFKFFMGFVRNLGACEYRITLKTVLDIATKMTIGVAAPIFDKLDPLTIGEDYRENRLAFAYGERLNTHSKNLNRTREFDALEALLSQYWTHGFAIDPTEASALFKNVKPISAEIIEVVNQLGPDACVPRSRRQEQAPRMEFLNDAPEQPTKGEPTSAKEAGSASGEPNSGNGNGSRQLPRNSQTRGRPRTRNGNGAPVPDV